MGDILSSAQTRKSVARTLDGKYASSGNTSPSEATETNNQIAACDKAEPSQEASTKEKTNTEPVKYGDVFSLDIEDARYALSSDQTVTEIFVTNPKTPNKIGEKSSFFTAWISEELGELLSTRGRAVNY